MSAEFAETLSFETGAAFTLQLFHVSDQEANANSVDTIPNFSAVLNYLMAEDIDGDGIDGYGDTLFLSSGDAWIPGLFYDASATVYGQGGAADLLIQNLLGVQAIAFGNHEWDKGNTAIANILQGLAANGTAAFDAADFPYLSGNIDLSGDPALQGLVTADGQAAEDIAGKIAGTTVVSTANGTRIGVVAATTPTLPVISSPSGQTVVTPAQFAGSPTAEELDALAAVIQEDVDALLAANPDLDKVVLLAHMQDIRIEEALATRLSGVDIIVAGGSNTRLFDEDDAGFEGDAAQGEYPYFTTDADGLPIAVVNTDYQYKYVGRLVIDFDENGNIIPESYDATVSGAYATDDANVAALGATGMEDPEIVAITEAIRGVIVEGESEWYAAATVFLNGNRTGGVTDGVRTQETNLGDLTADANLAYAQGYDDTVLVSIKNGGGIRASIGQTVVLGGSTGEVSRLPNEAVPGAKPEGGISSNDIGNVLAFNNGLSLVSLTTAELAAVLEHAVSNDPFTQEAGAGSFGQFGGLRFSFDPDAEPGSRVQNAVIVDDAGAVLYQIVRDGEVVDNGDATFRTVTLNYLADGGDGYPLSDLENADRVNLYDLGAAAGYDAVDTFAAGYEKDALAEYLLASFGTDPDSPTYDVEDTVLEHDTRIQNLDYRATDTSFYDTSDRSGLTILLTNDDGYSAEGINVMYEALVEAGHTVYLVAPKGQNSGGGSTLGGTDALLSGIEILEYEAGKWWVDGTPTTAVMAGLDEILAGRQIDLVISGTNEGENVGAFANISGTLGAAVEPIARGIPAIAFSAGSRVDGNYEGAYERAGIYATGLIADLMAAQEGETLLPAGTGLTVNVPSADPLGVAFTEITAEAPYLLGVQEYVPGNPATYGLAVTAGTVSGAATSEVSMFLQNYLTVSALDGNWTADADTRDELETAYRESNQLQQTMDPVDVPSLRIVLTNDDGVGSAGTEALYDALVAAGHEVVIVAPMTSQEGAGTGLTLSSFMVTEYSEGWFVDATPSTVVGTALGALMTGEDAPDLVVAGINDGLLTGADLRYSGTAGAIQAALMGFGTGVISVAAESSDDYAFASSFTVDLINDLALAYGEDGLLPEGIGLSVNIPDGASFLSDVVFTANDQASESRLVVGELYQGGYGFTREAGLSSSDAASEGEALADGAITITALDANYGADDATGDALGDLLGMELGEVDTGTVRVATYNVSLNRSAAGGLIDDLSDGSNAQAQNIAQIIQTERPEIILLNEFDYDAEGMGIELFLKNYLNVSQDGAEPIDYPYVYVAASNTGIDSGFDLNNDGQLGTADDAYGYGAFEGQYGFVILSQHPIVEDGIRTFQNFLWADMPDSMLTERSADGQTLWDPADPDGSYYSAEEAAALRLSSKSHVDVPVEIDGEIVHILAAHPTPPTFDGSEDRNGKRNHDEIRLWSDYIKGADYIYDDAGTYGGLEADARFVILGDYNADPLDGDSRDSAIDQILDNALVTGSATDAAITPEGEGSLDNLGGVNAGHTGNAAFDTADFGFNAADPAEDVAPGNLRVDYVLPSANGIAYVDGQVVWPADGTDYAAVTSYPTSDHRMVWADLKLVSAEGASVAHSPILAEAEDGKKVFADSETGAIVLDFGRADFSILAIADLDGDGAKDLLARNDSEGWLKAFFAAGGGAILGNKSNDVVATLDSDGDGSAELLMRSANGAYFLADGTTGARIEGLMRAGHEMFAAADMNGDGMDDILTVRPDGTLAWLDLAQDEGHGFGRGTGTVALGVADADGNGTADLIVESGIGRVIALDAEGQTVANYGARDDLGALLATGNFVSGGGDELVFATGTGVAVRDGMTGAVLATLEGALAGVYRGDTGFVDELVFETETGHAKANIQTGEIVDLGLADRTLILENPLGFGGLSYGDDIA